MATEIRWRRGTTAEHAAFTGALAEVTVDTDKNSLVVHDGSTAGGFPTITEGTLVDYATLASPTFTGVPAAPTAAAGTNTTQLATTAFTRTIFAAPPAIGNTTPAAGTFTTLTASSGNVLVQQGTVVPSSSGTAIDFTGLPSGVKRFRVMFNGVSLSGTADVLIQLGDSGGFETTTYVSGTASLSNGVYPMTISSSSGILLPLSTAAGNKTGVVDFSLFSPDSIIWLANGITQNSIATSFYVTSGYKQLSSELTQIRITTTNGTDTFDTGSINIQWEL